jgi:hypothetical protein
MSTANEVQLRDDWRVIKANRDSLRELKHFPFAKSFNLILGFWKAGDGRTRDTIIVDGF